jgi:hypothetical protein
MKLADIIREEEWDNSNPDFKTKHYDTDDETGQMSWKVEYTPLSGVNKSIETAYQDFKKAIREFPEDSRLEELFEEFASFKRGYRTHFNRKYKK